MLQRVALPIVDPRAFPARHPPGLFRFQIRWPERPSSALHWPNGMNRAPGGGPGFRTSGQELAIPVGVLQQAPAPTDASQVLAAELLGRELQKGRYRLGFFPIDPDISWCTAATTATAFAGKTEPVGIPVEAGIGSGHAGFPQHFLYFLPDPHGQGSFRPGVLVASAFSTGASGIGASSSETISVRRRFSPCFRS